LVVISIIGLLASIVLVSLNSARSKARDAQRKANLNQIAKALELYYGANNSYPNTGGSWSGECTLNGAITATTTNGVIPGLAPAYVSSLPHDSNTNISNGNATCGGNTTFSCYAYRSNGTDYKFMAHCLPENNVAADSLSDPARTSWAWAVFTPGASAW
jgi:type II secretory pathway pseudopilin PulG